MLGFSIRPTKNFQMSKLGLEEEEETDQIAICWIIEKARKAGSSLFLGSKMMWDFQFYVVQLFLHCIFSNVIGVLDMWPVYLMIYATVLA